MVLRALTAWGRLLRVSLFPSAAADIAAGIVLAAGRWPSGWAPWAAILGSLAVYHGGMILNDWADAPHDRATRPDRPIPAGAIAPGVALSAAWTLLFAGPLVALAAGRPSASLLATAAALAVVYDLWGRGPWSGPLLLAACRAANLGAGLAAGRAVALADAPPALLFALAPLGYGAYVFLVSRLGRLEDGEDAAPLARRPSVLLQSAAFVLVAIGALAFVARPATGPWPALALAAAGAFGLFHLGFTTRTWTLPAIGAAMGAALRRLLIVTAALALAAHGPHGLLVAAAILAGYPLSYWLRGYFPPS